MSLRTPEQMQQELNDIVDQLKMLTITVQVDKAAAMREGVTIEQARANAASGMTSIAGEALLKRCEFVQIEHPQQPHLDTMSARAYVFKSDQLAQLVQRVYQLGLSHGTETGALNVH